MASVKPILIVNVAVNVVITGLFKTCFNSMFIALWWRNRSQHYCFFKKFGNVTVRYAEAKQS